MEDGDDTCQAREPVDRKIGVRTSTLGFRPPGISSACRAPQQIHMADETCKEAGGCFDRVVMGRRCF